MADINMVLLIGILSLLHLGSYRSVGCWRDRSARAIPTLEGSDSRLNGEYEGRENAIQKCYQVASERGFKYFAVQNGGWCASSANAGVTYRKYGKSTACRKGKGGGWANDVYVINGNHTFYYHYSYIKSLN